MDLDLDLPEVQRDEVLCTFISSLLSSIKWVAENRGGEGGVDEM